MEVAAARREKALKWGGPEEDAVSIKIGWGKWSS